MTASTACPSCAVSCPPGSHFCPACGAALESPPAHTLERKIVSVLFCDLVGYTALCERLDPEDTDRLLRDFYAAARRAIENYGGLVEKFIGDAAVGVFGVPAAREDDAERAVRAALRLRDEVPHLPRVANVELAARSGVNTGLAVVRHDAALRSGEGFLVGDAVNTAARFQQLAPPEGIVVGKITAELTADTILYEPLPAAHLKGKRKAIPCFLVRSPVSRRGIDPQRRFAAPLVGREVESSVLRGLLKKASASSRPQFALIVGEAGIGKSRLVAEFFRYVENRPRLVRWRQGSCPSYGDGLAFWAVGEIVKEQLGVLDSDGAAAIEAKLARGLAGLPESEWLAARLRPLLGLSSPPASREENYAAWTRFLGSLAADMPAVVVFEDLHHAGESTLDFLFHLVEHSADVPLLVLGTARPEELQDRAEALDRLAALVAARRLLRVDLVPLSGSETGDLVDHLLGDLEPTPETRRAVSDRAAGNPLFVEQLASHLRSAVSPADRSDSAAKKAVNTSLPATLQSLIAARLDQLPTEEKIVLADAAVVGQVFWTGAIAALDHGDRDTAERRLADLTRRDLVHPERDSTLAGEPQFAFHHALIREVAYEQLPRVERAVKHAAVARWIETTPARDEAAEIVAHHYVRALGLAEAAGDHELHAELLEPTLQALKLAGDHALPLDVAAAERYYDKAVRLAGDGPQRPSMLVAWSEALLQGGRFREAVEALDQGISGLRALGDDHAADAAAARSWYYHWSLADGKMLLSSEVMELAEAVVASPELLAALESCGERLSYNGRIKLSLQFADRALALCAELQLPESLRMVDLRGGDRCILGDVGGLDDFRHALELARARQAGHLTCVIAANLAEYLALFEGPGSALEVHLEALEMARQRQDQLATCFCRTGLFIDRIWAGRWDAALAEADGLLAFLEERNYLWDLPLAHATHAQLRAWRGDSAAAAEKAAWAEERSRETPLVATRVTCLMSSATVEAGLGNEGPALRLLNACGALLNDVEGMDAPCALRMPEAIRLAIDLGQPALAHNLAQGLPAARPFDAATLTVLEALLCEHRGDHGEAAARFAAAADRWRSLDVPYEQAHAHLGRGRCLTALGRSVEARAALSLARDGFAALGAQPALQKAQELLAVLAD